MKGPLNNRLDPPCQNVLYKFPHKSNDLERAQNGSMIMNERNLKIICQHEGLYEYPEMNNKIYLHFKIIEKIQCLDKYLNLKTLYLQNNVITKIQNLNCLVHLQNLFLQNNMIKKIQNLQKLKELRVINLSNNNVFKIQGLSQLPLLQNFNLANNYLKQFDDLEHLGHCTTELTSIDLSNNHIKANQQLLNLIPQVKCLYLYGNPLVRETKHYRRVVVGTLKNLLYVDQRGVDKQQRMLSEAWVERGQLGFKQAKQNVMKHRQGIKQEKRQEIMKDIDVHRSRKISIFSKNIKQFQEQIEKIQGYMNQKGNQANIYFYELKIAELYEKIKQNQEFINNISKRIGAAATGLNCESQKSIRSQSDKNNNKIISHKFIDHIQEQNSQSDKQNQTKKKQTSIQEQISNTKDFQNNSMNSRTEQEKSLEQSLIEPKYQQANKSQCKKQQQEEKKSISSHSTLFDELD